MPPNYIPEYLTIQGPLFDEEESNINGITFLYAKAKSVTECDTSTYAASLLFSGAGGDVYHRKNFRLLDPKVIGPSMLFSSSEGVCFTQEELFWEELFRGHVVSPSGGAPYLSGEYQWVVYSGTLRLARVGSDIHNACLAVTKPKSSTRNPKNKPLKASELTTGTQYETKKGVLVYAGRVRDTTTERLCFAWYQHTPSAKDNEFSRGAGWKKLIISASSLAFKEVEGPRPSIKGAALTAVVDVYGCPIVPAPAASSRYTWPDGRSVHR